MNHIQALMQLPAECLAHLLQTQSAITIAPFLARTTGHKLNKFDQMLLSNGRSELHIRNLEQSSVLYDIVSAASSENDTKTWSVAINGSEYYKEKNHS